MAYTPSYPKFAIPYPENNGQTNSLHNDWSVVSMGAQDLEDCAAVSCWEAPVTLDTLNERLAALRRDMVDLRALSMLGQADELDSQIVMRLDYIIRQVVAPLEKRIEALEELADFAELTKALFAEKHSQSASSNFFMERGE